MSMTFSEADFTAGDAFWIFTDIDGHGKRWMLAVIRGEHFGDESEIYFPFDDFGDNLHEGYAKNPVLKIEPPRGKP